MNVSKVIENSSQVIHDVLNLILCLVESFFEIGTSAEMSFDTASQNDGSKWGLLVDALNCVVKLN